MKRRVCNFILAAAAVLGIMPLGACSDVEENYLPDLCGEYGSTEETNDPPVPAPAAAPRSVSAVGQRSETAAQTADIGIPELANRSEISGDKLTYTIENVFADGGYYTVSVEGEGIDGERRHKITLSRGGEVLDSLEIDVPDGEKFLITDSVSEGLSYGCTVISNKRDFSTDVYPDIVQLDFYKPNESEIPQYGRFFAVFDGRLEELPVYESGVEAAPLGTHLELRGEGRMVQHLCVYTPSGKSLMVTKYEYIFDTEARRLNKREVKFLGWNVDN